MTAMERFGVKVRVYWGLWVVDCPLCNCCMALREWVDEFTCDDCGVTLPAEWPTDDVAIGVVRLLSLRPSATNRNWNPDESLHDLLAENVEHGVFGGNAGDVLAIVGDRIITDTLPAGPSRDAIGAY